MPGDGRLVFPAVSVTLTLWGPRREIVFCMRHSLYRYFTERKWADEFLDGKMRFRSLATFATMKTKAKLKR